MNKNDIITLINADKYYMNFCKKLCNGRDIYKDLYQEFIMLCLEESDKEIIRLYNSGLIKYYCGTVIYNIYSNHNKQLARKEPYKNPCRSPLFELCNKQIIEDYCNHVINNDYDHKTDEIIEKVLVYLQEDEKNTLDDVYLLFESIDKKLIDISKESEIPYITIKTKYKRIKDRIKANVSI